MANALSTLDGKQITVVKSDGGYEPLIMVSTGTGGVQSVTAGVESGIVVDNTDPANPRLSNSGLLDIAVDAPLILGGSLQHPEISIDTTALGSTTVRANKNMVASVTTADGQLACATAVATTPAASSTGGGYVGASLNGVQMVVGDGTKSGVECYFSGNGGTTARAMQSIVAGDLLYFNGTVAGFQLSASDRWSFFYNVTT